MAARREDRAWRVITANCAGGNADVAAEALEYEPDIVLLQESPSEPELQRILERHPGYSLVSGYDASTIARGDLEELPVEQDHLGFLTIAEAMLGDRPVTVMNTRLLLPYCDIDLWRPAAWRAAGEGFRAREAQMDAIAHYIQEIKPNTPLIVGGDFNSPPGDSLFRKLRPRLRDSFPEAGIGLGNTIINDIPISRIDQVWVSQHFRVHSVLARRTEHSDHRLVLCDLSLAP
jgi:endonuclease/exonuclease/phosphatase family metal-dependent hydrolase